MVFQATNTASRPLLVAKSAAVGEVLVAAKGMAPVARHLLLILILYFTALLNWPFQARKVPCNPFTSMADSAGVVLVKAFGTAGLCLDQGGVGAAIAAPAAARAQTVPAAAAAATSLDFGNIRRSSRSVRR